MPLNPLAAELKQLNDRVYALERRGVYPPAVADSSWKVVGAAGQPAFQNSWVNFPTGGWPTAAFRLDSEGWIQMRGLLTGGVNNTVAFTLPVGHRPALTQVIRTNAQDQAGYIIVLPTGTVSIFGAALAFVSLDHVTFPTWNTDSLRFQRVFMPQYVNDPYNRFLRMVLRRSGMWEFLGLTGPLDTQTSATLNGVGPDMTDLYNIHGTSPNYARLDLGNNRIVQNQLPAATLATWGIFGGIRWPSIEIEPLYATLTLLNGWADYGWGGSSYFSPACYYKDTNGYVHLRGLIKNAGGTATTVVGTLPAGFRPGGRSMFTVFGNAGPYGIEVNASGTITPRNASDRSAMSLAGISFLAEN